MYCKSIKNFAETLRIQFCSADCSCEVGWKSLCDLYVYGFAEHVCWGFDDDGFVGEVAAYP